MKVNVLLKKVFLIILPFTPMIAITSCHNKLPYANIVLNKNEITLNQTNSTEIINASVELSNNSFPAEPVIYEWDEIKNSPILFIQNYEQKQNNQIAVSIDTDKDVPETRFFTIFATYPNSTNKPRIPIKIKLEAYTHVYPNAQISISKNSINLGQTNFCDSVTSTINLDDPTQLPKNITYDYSEVKNLPIFFQQEENTLTITLETGVVISEDATFLIYAKYPYSQNKPQESITINVEKYIPPAPTPEQWEDEWIPKANLIINDSTLSGVTSVNNKKILHIPREITKIGDSAFKSNVINGVTTVDFPNESKCITIGNYAFDHCGTIKIINFPSTIVNIGIEAFAYCTALEKLDFSSCSSLTNIPNSMALSCTNLAELKLPPHCVSIADSAFNETLALNGDLVIPKSVRIIGTQAFLNAGYDYSGSNQNSLNLIFEDESNLVSTNYASFSGMPIVGTVEFPPSLKNYGNNFFAFSGAHAVKINSRSQNNFGTNCFDGTKFKELYLNVNDYFSYPKDFLLYSYIKDKDDGKIYVNNNLIDQFKNGWITFSQKFYSL